jgi:hypothetical protein
MKCKLMWLKSRKTLHRKCSLTAQHFGGALSVGTTFKGAVPIPVRIPNPAPRAGSLCPGERP